MNTHTSTARLYISLLYALLLCSTGAIATTRTRPTVQERYPNSCMALYSDVLWQPEKNSPPPQTLHALLKQYCNAPDTLRSQYARDIAMEYIRCDSLPRARQWLQGALAACNHWRPNMEWYAAQHRYILCIMLGDVAYYSGDYEGAIPYYQATLYNTPDRTICGNCQIQEDIYLVARIGLCYTIIGQQECAIMAMLPHIGLLYSNASGHSLLHLIQARYGYTTFVNTFAAAIEQGAWDAQQGIYAIQLYGHTVELNAHVPYKRRMNETEQNAMRYAWGVWEAL